MTPHQQAINRLRKVALGGSINIVYKEDREVPGL